MTHLFKNRYFVSLTFFFGIIGISFLFAHLFGKDQIETTQIPQSTHNKPLGQIMQGEVFIQELHMKKEILHSFEIELATWNRKNSNLNKLLIVDQDMEILEELAFSSDSIKDNNFQLFKLKKPIQIGKDQPYFICLISDEGKSNNCITAWIDTNGVAGKLYKEPLINNGIKQAVKMRKTQIKGSLQIKIFESDNSRFTKFFIFMFFLLVISVILIYNLNNKRWGKNHESIFISIIVIILFVPSLYFSFFNTKKTQTSNWEKRTLATLPEFNLQNLGTFLPNLEIYINDHIPYREEIISFRAKIYYKLFGKSAFPNTSVIGKNEWFFRAREVLTANGNRTISKEDVNKMSELFHKRIQYYESLGIKFYIAVVPSKSEIYKENLPIYCKPNIDIGFTSDIINGLSKDTTLNLINLEPDLIKAKGEGQVFYKTDMHWSALGAFHGYTTIINRIRKDFPAIKPVTANNVDIVEGKETTSGDATELALQDIVTEKYSYLKVKTSHSIELPKSKYKIPENFKHHDEYLVIRGVPDTTLPKILVIRDSFTQALTGILSENFSKTIYIWDNWKYGINKEIVEEEKPDIVLIEVYIGFLPNVLEYPE